MITTRVKLIGGPLDGKYAKIQLGENPITADGHKYAQANEYSKQYVYVPEIVPPPLPEPLPEQRRVELRPNDAILVEFPYQVTDAAYKQVKADLRTMYPDRKVIILDCGAKLSTISSLTPLSADWIDEKARAIGLTNLHAPPWFEELVREVETAHNIKG